MSHVVFELNREDIEVPTSCNIVMMFPHFFWHIISIKVHPVIDHSNGLGNKNT